jgi:hypothetical protein
MTAADPQDRHCRAEFPHEDRELRSAEMGHLAISDQQVELALFSEFPSLEAIRGFDHFIPVVGAHGRRGADGARPPAPTASAGQGTSRRARAALGPSVGG